MTSTGSDRKKGVLRIVGVVICQQINWESPCFGGSNQETGGCMPSDHRVRWPGGRAGTEQK